MLTGLKDYDFPDPNLRFLTFNFGGVWTILTLLFEWPLINSTEESPRDTSVPLPKPYSNKIQKAFLWIFNLLPLRKGVFAYLDKCKLYCPETLELNDFQIACELQTYTVVFENVPSKDLCEVICEYKFNESVEKSIAGEDDGDDSEEHFFLAALK